MLEKLNPELCQGILGTLVRTYYIHFLIAFTVYKLFIFLSISKWEGSLT